MEIKKLKKDHWEWELAEPFWSLEPEWLSQLEDPQKDFRSRLILRQGRELWFETKLYHPRLPPLVWLRLKDYSELNLFHFLTRKTALEKSWRVSCELSSETSALAQPLAYGQKRQGVRIQREVLVFEALPHFQPLSQFLRENFDPQQSRNSFEDKKEILEKLGSAFHEIFVRKILPDPATKLDDLWCRLEQDLRIVFCFPETLRRTRREQSSLIAFLTWLELAIRPYLPKNYRFRLLRDFLKAESRAGKAISSLISEIWTNAEEILLRQREKIDREFWRKKEFFFWFETKEARVFLHYSIDQNQVLELLPRMALLSRKREKIRLYPIGSKEPQECEVFALSRSGGKRDLVSQAFRFSLQFMLLQIPHQEPLIGVESVRGDFLIYQSLSSFSLSLNEYLARLLADELSGKSWDRRFLLRLAHLLLLLHEQGLVYENPQGDEIWVEEGSGGRVNFYLTHLERLRAVSQLEAEFAGRNLFEIFSSLPLSEPDAMIILEEYLRHTKKFKNLKMTFPNYLHLIRRMEKEA